MDHSALVIDGALPRTEQERVSRLLDFAGGELDKLYVSNTAMTFPSKLYMRFHELQDEYAVHVDEDGFEHWNALEDEVIELITDMLPTGWLCMLAESDPGTVIVTEYEEDID